MNSSISDYKRKSFIEQGEIYFWTATINKWQYLLKGDAYKNIVVSSLKYLSDAGKIDVFAFVIMPNHIHLIWRINNQNGKETAQGSFLKYTAHEFKKLIIRDKTPIKLSDYAVDSSNKNYEFWQRDSLAVHLYTRDVAYQKMDYIHLNPLATHWQLAKEPCEYQYSSAKFYELGIKEFSFLKDLREEF
jgi:REP element-mobilizing transposase RayT